MGPGSFRLLLAALVFVSHVTGLNAGRPAVMIFFALSGFWVSRMFVERGSESRRRFVVVRLLRVWPMVALVTIVVTAVLLATGSAEWTGLGSTIVLLGLASRHQDIVGVLWSLDIEAQFYLLVPAVFVLAAFSRPLLYLAIGLAYLAGLALAHWHFPTVLLYAPAFFAGGCIAVSGYAPSRGEAAASALVYAAVLGIAAGIPLFRGLVIKQQDLWWHDSAFMAAAFCLIPFVAWNLRQPSSAADRTMGDLAFPFYLCHLPIIRLVHAAMPWTPAAKLLALAVSAAVTWALFVWFDRPVDAWRRRLRRRWLDRSAARATIA